MTNSKKSYKRLSKAEQKEFLGETEFNEYERINEQIQQMHKAQEIYADYVNKLPKMPFGYRAMKRFYELDSFDSFRFLSKTKKNLRKAFQHNPRSLRVDFSPFTGTFTTRIYANQIVQSFFEFSLFYSYIKRIELSFKKAKIIYSKAYKVSLGSPLANKTETQSFIEFLDFFYQRKGVFDPTNLPAHIEGRPRGKRTDDTEKILNLAKQGMSNSEISRELEPMWKDGGKRRAEHIAEIGRTCRRYKIYAKKRQKTKG